jgi:hypothetical protein
MVAEVSSIRPPNSHLLDQRESDLGLSDDADIRLAGNKEEDVNLEDELVDN